MVRMRPAPLCAAAAALLTLTAACADDGDPSSRPTTSPSSSRPPSTSPVRTPSTATTPSPTPTASAPDDPADAKKQIRASWSRFFSPRSSVEERAKVAENGDLYKLMLEALADDPKARTLRVRIDSVRFTSDQRATVRYTLFSDGRRVGPTAPGASVRQDGAWKVSFATVCSLTKYGKDVPRAAEC
ncbi:hypothetical protein [Streptomyces sp. MK37H]|uniref:hypothetical protein n=1 Tax=Streptomyces sp. MK37H TaxID=2699117 RepID=UPI001B38D35C|nr:hypothetical protein [Streptomyces sp. MK37H]MBP8535535.1 hypothetical protein [Streptomyces sp. MK37H]